MTTVNKPILNALTVDVEDYFQVSAFENQIERNQWHTFPSRVVNNTHRLLDLFERHNVKATFFILGWIAHEYPQLVADIHSQGHELGTHSFWHQLVYQQTPDEFRNDLRDSIQAIKDASGIRVTSYRAPSFSITSKSEWALKILSEEGIQIDSSIYPIYHDRYGMPTSKNGIHQRETGAGSIIEFPPSVLKTQLGNLPISGGGYFRLYPKRLTSSCIARINRRGLPYMFYMHPWEVDPEQPKIPNVSATRTWRHRVNLRTTYAKLEVILSRFEFGTMSEAIRQSTSVTSLQFEKAKHVSCKVTL